MLKISILKLLHKKIDLKQKQFLSNFLDSFLVIWRCYTDCTWLMNIIMGGRSESLTVMLYGVATKERKYRGDNYVNGIRKGLSNIQYKIHGVASTGIIDGRQHNRAEDLS